MTTRDQEDPGQEPMTIVRHGVGDPIGGVVLVQEEINGEGHQASAHRPRGNSLPRANDRTRRELEKTTTTQDFPLLFEWLRPKDPTAKSLSDNPAP